MKNKKSFLLLSITAVLLVFSGFLLGKISGQPITNDTTNKEIIPVTNEGNSDGKLKIMPYPEQKEVSPSVDGSENDNERRNGPNSTPEAPSTSDYETRLLI